MAGGIDYIQRQDAVLHMQYKHNFFFQEQVGEEKSQPCQKEQQKSQAYNI